MNINDLVFIDNLPSLDLHGLTRTEANLYINDFINENIKLKNSFILIIHGIGKNILKAQTKETLSKNKNVLYGILDEAFSEIGKPYKMYVNNRKALAYITKSLDSLNIENEFLREEKVTNDNIELLMQAFYNPKLDEIVEESDLVNSLMDVITKTLNTLNEDDFIDEDYNTSKTNAEFIS